FLQFFRLLEQPDAKAVLSKRQGRRQPPDAGADDQYGVRGHLASGAPTLTSPACGGGWGGGSFRVRTGAFGRARGPRCEGRVETVQGRAIGAYDFRVLAHVEEYMRVIERRQRADTHELLGADLDEADARVVVEMGYDPLRHAIAFASSDLKIV